MSVDHHLWIVGWLGLWSEFSRATATGQSPIVMEIFLLLDFMLDLGFFILFVGRLVVQEAIDGISAFRAQALGTRTLDRLAIDPDFLQVGEITHTGRDGTIEGIALQMQLLQSGELFEQGRDFSRE